ncbi:FAD-binding oxidoreductase [Flavobacteriaceae bacterium LMO-SS05]
MKLIFPYRTQLIKKEQLNHNVFSFKLEKPYHYHFKVGQAVDLSIDKPGYELDVAPFTIANLDEDSFLEFIIKIKPDTESLTYGMSQLVPGDVLQISEPWDSYTYKGEGVFIAAGTGITPFLPIINDLKKKGKDVKHQHKLIYANRSKKDILFRPKLKRIFGESFINVLSQSKSKTSIFGRIDRNLLVSHISTFNQNFYICGPKSFEENVTGSLLSLGINKEYIQTGFKF